MKHLLLIVGLVFVLGGAAAFGDYRDHVLYQNVTTSHYIRVTGHGDVALAFDDALTLFLQEDILDAVQQAYARLLKPGELPEFEVDQHAPGHWSYINKSGQRSDIRELHRDLEAGGGALLVLYSEGERFFGDFRLVTEIAVVPEDEGMTRYDIVVYAYPVNSFSRFFARRLGVVDRFFRAKTKEITELTVAICRVLVTDEPDNSPDNAAAL